MPIENTPLENTIPEMIHKLGRYWDQPSRDLILVDDTHALMDETTFKKLANYSMSKPSGVYPGKMWKQKSGGKWYLRWFGADDGDPRGLITPAREISLI